MIWHTKDTGEPELFTLSRISTTSTRAPWRRTKQELHKNRVGGRVCRLPLPPPGMRPAPDASVAYFWPQQFN